MIKVLVYGIFFFDRFVLWLYEEDFDQNHNVIDDSQNLVLDLVKTVLNNSLSDASAEEDIDWIKIDK